MKRKVKYSGEEERSAIIMLRTQILPRGHPEYRICCMISRPSGVLKGAWQIAPERPWHVLPILDIRRH